MHEEVHVRSIDLSAGRLTRVAAGNVGRPVLSGDGTTTVFSQWDGSQWEVMRHREGGLENLSADPRHDIEPAVSENGDVVVWSRFGTESINDPEGSWDLYQFRDGAVSRLTSAPGHETEPAISGDASTVVYTYDDPKSRIGYDLWRYRQGKHEQLTEGGSVDRQAVVNHDGSRIFWSRVDRGEELWFQGSDGRQKPLTYSSMREWDPAINRDGTKVVWSHEQRGDHDLVRFALDDPRPQSVSGERRVQETDGDLSADGESIVFTRRAKGQPSQVVLAENGELAAIPHQGAHLAQISDDGKVLVWRTVEGSESVIYRWQR